MVTIELIEELKKRVNVSYEDAKDALEKSNEDLLEAIIYLEKNKKFTEETNSEAKGKKEDKFSGGVHSVFGWCKDIVMKGNRNFFVIKKKENTTLKLPITLLAIILLVAPYISIPLLVLALFTGHRFSVAGKEVENTKANETLTKLSNVADNVKDEFSK